MPQMIRLEGDDLLEDEWRCELCGRTGGADPEEPDYRRAMAYRHVAHLCRAATEEQSARAYAEAGRLLDGIDARRRSAAQGTAA